FGRLAAHSFSYSGNPQGCDHVIRHLHTALENLQAKLSRQPVIESPGAAGAPSPMGASPLLPPAVSPLYRSSPMPDPASGPGRQPGTSIPAPAGSVPTGPVIPLSPSEPTR